MSLSSSSFFFFLLLSFLLFLSHRRKKKDCNSREQRHGQLGGGAPAGHSNVRDQLERGLGHQNFKTGKIQCPRGYPARLGPAEGRPGPPRAVAGHAARRPALAAPPRARTHPGRLRTWRCALRRCGLKAPDDGTASMCGGGAPAQHFLVSSSSGGCAQGRRGAARRRGARAVPGGCGRRLPGPGAAGGARAARARGLSGLRRSGCKRGASTC